LFLIKSQNCIKGNGSKIVFVYYLFLHLFEKKQKTTAVRRRFWKKIRPSRCTIEESCGPDKKKLADKNIRNVRTKGCLCA